MIEIFLDSVKFLFNHIIVVKDKKIKKIDYIKQNILDPMESLVNRNYNNQIGDNIMFEIEERYGFTSKSIQYVLDSHIHIWDENEIHNTYYESIINKKLYKELKNYKITKDMDIEFEEILNLIIKNSPLYLEKLSELYDKVAGLEEFNNLIKRIEQKHKNDNDYIGNYIRLIIVLSLDYNVESNFKNYYRMAKEDKEYENVNTIVSALKNNNNDNNELSEISSLKSLKGEIKTKIKAFENRMADIDLEVFIG